MNILEQALNLIKQFGQGTTYHMDFGPPPPQATTVSTPQPIPAPVTTQPTALTPDQVAQGFRNFNPNSPLASQSGVISQALSQLPTGIDPKLVLGLALKETRGGMDLQNPNRANSGVNNPWNVKPGGHLVNYPDLKTALLGGDNSLENTVSQGLIKVLSSPAYSKYRQTGNLGDFFNVYSNPQSGNPPLPTQVQQAQTLMKNWP